MEQRNLGEIVIFNTEDGDVRVQIDTANETIWLTQKGMAELFGCTPMNVSSHLKTIFKEKELDENSVIKKFFTTAADGKKYLTMFYNLDAIIAVGYRVNGKRATAFRIWATRTLREYLVKGYVLDDNRFKSGLSMTYWKELLGRIREIRISERVFYQQVRDIYKLSIDYDKDDDRTLDFFAKIQNKLLWAVSGKTAAELIYYRANAKLPQMGLTSTDREGVVRVGDIVVGKNYLQKDELDNLKLIVEQYLSFAEAQAINHIPMRMADWEQNLNIILTMNRRDILETKGKVSMELAKKKARLEYNAYKEHEHLEDIRELDRDIRAAGKIPPNL